MTQLGVRLALVLGLLSLVQQALAEGDKKQACAGAYEEGQRLQRRGALLEARKYLLLCGGLQCPTVMHADCEHWLSQVEASMSTVVFQVVNDAGVEVAGARVMVDGGSPFALQGRAIELDPGKHELQFWAEGCEAKTIRYSFSEGQKLRREVVTLKTTQRPEQSVSSEQSSKPLANPRGNRHRPASLVSSNAGGRPPSGDLAGGQNANPDRSPRPGPLGTWPFWVATSVGVLGAGGFAYFGVTARNGDVRLGRCEPDCSRHDVDIVRRDYLLANVSLGISAVALLTASVILLVHPSSPSGSARTLRLGMSPMAIGPSAELSF